MGIAMNTVERQIIELNDKIDKIDDKVEGLSYQLTTLTGSKQQGFEGTGEGFATIGKINHSQMDSVMEHKDILPDNGDWQIHNQEEINPDIQIRRLTAQLTAAYNRIAALEEQLLARRVHS